MATNKRQWRQVRHRRNVRRLLFLERRWVDESVASQKPEYDALMQGGLMMGVLDDNMDGKLQPSELRGRQAAVLKTNFAMLDANHDGAADKDELAAAMKFLGNQRRPAAPAAPAAQTAPTAGAKPAVSAN